MSKRRAKTVATEQFAPNVNEPGRLKLISEDNKKLPKMQRMKFKHKTENQKLLWQVIHDNEVILCSGPAGTGKTYVALAKGLDLMLSSDNKYNRVVIIKPIVESDEKLGFLPGGIDEKIDPYKKSTIQNLVKLVGDRHANEFMEKNGDYARVEFDVLAYMRGVTIDNAVVIIDEAQNMTIKQFLTSVTRIGENCKFIYLGSIEQSDRFCNGKDSGFWYAYQNLKSLEGIGSHEFNKEDIVRNPIITKILTRFEEVNK